MPMLLGTLLSSKLPCPSNLQPNCFSTCQNRKAGFVTNCESSPQSDAAPSGGSTNLQIGSPIVVVEAPRTLKTAASMPTLKVNMGLVKPGDVGRIVARKPKDVWAVRLAIGTYLLDGKHFKPLELDK